MAKMDPVGYAEVVDPNKFITFSDMLRAAASTAGPTRRGPASSWDVPQAMSEPVIGQRPTPDMPAGLQSIVDRVMASAPEAAGPNAPPNSIATMISTGNMRAPAVQVGNGIVPNADVRGTYSAGGLDISGPGIVLPGGNVLGGVSAEERAPRRPETLPNFSSMIAASAPAGRQNTAPLPAREDRARGEPYVTAAQAAAPQGEAAAGSPISIVRALQNTNYLPVMDAQGRVSYQSEGAIQDRAARAAAAEAAKAKMDLDRSTAIKNVKKSPVEQAQEFEFKRAMDFDRLANTYPEGDDRRAKAIQTRDAIIQSLMVKTTGSPAENAIAEMIDSIRQRQNQGTGIQG